MCEDIFSALFFDSKFENEHGVSSDFFDGNVNNGFVCDNCFSSDWDVDEMRGDLCCVNCGCCVGGLMVHSVGRENSNEKGDQNKTIFCENARSVAFDSIGIRSASMEQHKKQTYRRKIYFSDRMSQWLQCERKIPKCDFAVIKREWRKDLDRQGISAVLPTKESLRRCRGTLVAGGHALEKKDIRRILRACDDVNEAERIEKLNQWPDNPLFKFHRQEYLEKPPSFVSRYLEKWLSLRWRLTGVQSTARNCPHQLFEELMRYLSKLDQSFPVCIQNEKRRAFPSFNETVRNLMQLLFMDCYNSDFPRLQTQRARNKSNYHWWQFCKFHKWPFLLKDTRFLKVRSRRRK